MNTLSLNDACHLEAAKRFLESGDYLEANDELANIHSQWRAHPEVLSLRWQAFAQAGRWNIAVELADQLMRKQTGKELAETMYQLASHAGRLNLNEEARCWLDKAQEASGDRMKERALCDPNFETVRIGN